MSVQPIKNTKKIQAIKATLAADEEETAKRDLLMFVIGINSALRITDILGLKVGEIIKDNGEFHEHFHVVERKTGKTSQILINDEIKKAFQLYQKKYSYVSSAPDHYLIFSARPRGGKKIGEIPLGRIQAWKVLKKIGKIIGEPDLGTKKKKKTWGYHMRKKGIDILQIMSRLNHSNHVTTYRYLGLDQEDLDDISREHQL